MSDYLRDNDPAHEGLARAVHGRTGITNWGNALLGRSLALLHSKVLGGIVQAHR
jgi:hypothetical protein